MRGAQEMQLCVPDPVPFNTCAHAAHFYWAPHEDTGYYSITPTYLFDENMRPFQTLFDASEIWIQRGEL